MGMPGEPSLCTVPGTEKSLLMEGGCFLPHPLNTGLSPRQTRRRPSYSRNQYSSPSWASRTVVSNPRPRPTCPEGGGKRGGENQGDSGPKDSVCPTGQKCGKQGGFPGGGLTQWSGVRVPEVKAAPMVCVANTPGSQGWKGLLVRPLLFRWRC